MSNVTRLHALFADACFGDSEAALAGKRSVAEGYESAPAVRELARRQGVEMPICEAVAALLAGETTVDAMIEGLLSRPLKAERA